MGILAKYLCKEFFKLTAICLTVFVSLYLIIDFLQKIDNALEAHASFAVLAAFFFYKLPHITIQMIPVAVLISVIIMFSLMKKHNEITALKACGISITKISLPVILASTGLAVSVFLLSELVVPYCSSKSISIWNKDIKKRDQKRFYGHNHIWYKGHNSIYWIRHFDKKKMIMEDPTFYFFDNSFRLTKRIQGRSAIWTGKKWRIKKAVVQELIKGGCYELNRSKQLDITLPESPEAFLTTEKKPEEMSYWQLAHYAEKIQLEGYNATRYLVDMNIKLAYPVISIIMAFLGISISLGLKRGGTPLAVSVGIASCFLYLVTIGFARALGLSGVLPPCFSAWIANFIFFLFGVYLMMCLET